MMSEDKPIKKSSKDGQEDEKEREKDKDIDKDFEKDIPKDIQKDIQKEMHDNDREKEKEWEKEKDAGDKSSEAGQQKDVVDAGLQTRIDRGVQLVIEGQAANEKGHTEKAYEKYCRGLQHLLDVMPRLGEESPQAQELRTQINGYLDEAEKLKHKLDAAEAAVPEPPHATSPPEVAPVLVPVQKPAQDERIKDTRAPVLDAGFKSRMMARIIRGEALIGEAKQLESRRHFDESYQKYCRGLQCLLEVIPKLGEDSAQVGPLRANIVGYLEQAERLKERLEEEQAGSVGAGTLPSAIPSLRLKERTSARPVVVEEDGHRADSRRSRSHHRHHRHHARRHHGSRSRRRHLKERDHRDGPRRETAGSGASTPVAAAGTVTLRPGPKPTLRPQESTVLPRQAPPSAQPSGHAPTSAPVQPAATPLLRPKSGAPAVWAKTSSKLPASKW